MPSLKAHESGNFTAVCYSLGSIPDWRQQPNPSLPHLQGAWHNHLALFVACLPKQIEENPTQMPCSFFHPKQETRHSAPPRFLGRNVSYAKKRLWLKKLYRLLETKTNTCGLPQLIHFEPHPNGYVSKLNQETAAFSPCFHLPGFHFGVTHFRTYFSGWIESDAPWGLTDLDFDPQPNGSVPSSPQSPQGATRLPTADCRPRRRLHFREGLLGALGVPVQHHHAGAFLGADLARRLRCESSGVHGGEGRGGEGFRGRGGGGGPRAVAVV